MIGNILSNFRSFIGLALTSATNSSAFVPIRPFHISTLSLRENILQYMHYQGLPKRKSRSRDKSKVSGHNYYKGIVLKSKFYIKKR